MACLILKPGGEFLNETMATFKHPKTMEKLEVLGPKNMGEITPKNEGCRFLGGGGLEHVF